MQKYFQSFEKREYGTVVVQYCTGTNYCFAKSQRVFHFGLWYDTTVPEVPVTEKYSYLTVLYWYSTIMR